MIRIGKTVPMQDEEYEDWYRDNGEALRSGLQEISDTFMGFADVESTFFEDLAAASKRLP